MFEHRPAVTASEIRREYVDAPPVFRKLKMGVAKQLEKIEESRRAALNDDHSRVSSDEYYSQTDAWAEFLTDHGYRFSYLPIIVEMLLVFPTNSAGVERVFSATTWLKNERRNRMLDDLLNANLHVKLNDTTIDYTEL